MQSRPDPELGGQIAWHPSCKRQRDPPRTLVAALAGPFPYEELLRFKPSVSRTFELRSRSLDLCPATERKGLYMEEVGVRGSCWKCDRAI